MGKMLSDNFILSAFADEYSSSVDGQIRALNDNGIPYIELRFVDKKNIKDVSDDGLVSLKERLDGAEIRVSSVGSPVGKIDISGDLEKHLKEAERVFYIARFLGAKYVRIFSFYHSGISSDDARGAVLDALGKLLVLARKYDVTLCHENEALIYGESPEKCLELLEYFGGELKCVFDMGNFVLDGYDPVVAYGLLKDYIAYFHIKDALKEGAIVPAGMGDASICRILSEYEREYNTKTFITLEPHLQTFSGLNQLVGKNFDNPYKYETAEDAFTDAVRKLKEVLKMKEFTVDKLLVKIMPTRPSMGDVAAKDIHDCLIDLLKEKDEVNMIFAAAPSQNDVLKSLTAYSDIEWNRVNAFHMDEYLGLSADAPQRFGNFLREHIFDLVPFKSVNLIDPESGAGEECRRYAALLKQYPTDIVVMGIGENGHIAFNDPWVADFSDREVIKAVALDEVCRMQQVNDKCFEKLSDVPKEALTLTCPTLMKATYKFCIVPAPTKANAVYRTLNNEIGEECPATILRASDNAILYLEPDSAEKL